MANALFAFSNHEAARQAADQLVEAGLRPEAVRLHHAVAADQPLARQVDEQVSGGLITNMLNLFQGVFDWGGSPHDASAFQQTVQRGGAVVSVDVNSEEDRSKVDRLMQTAGIEQRTDWATAPA